MEAFHNYSISTLPQCFCSAVLFKKWDNAELQNTALETYQSHPKVDLLVKLITVVGDFSEGFNDPLGELYMQAISNGHNGQYFTPALQKHCLPLASVTEFCDIQDLNLIHTIMNIEPPLSNKVILQIKSDIRDASTNFNEANAKVFGEQYANGVLNKLFPKRQEYGDIKSHFNTERLGSHNFGSFKERVISIHYQRKKLTSELHHLSNQLNANSVVLNKLKSSLLSFLFKKKIATKAEQLDELSNSVNSLQKSKKDSFIDLGYHYEDSILSNAYSDLASAFTTLKSSIKIWDVTTAQMNLDTKAAAATSIDRHEVKFTLGGLDIFSTSEKVLHVENFNGGDFYFYPMFIIYFKGIDEIAIIDYTDLYIEYKDQQFLEQKNDIVKDVSVVGETWYRVNKDGSPDRRFVGNYTIPIVLYGSLHIKSPSGINELYYISDHSKARHFHEQYLKYQSMARSYSYVVSA